MYISALIYPLQRGCGRDVPTAPHPGTGAGHTSEGIFYHDDESHALFRFP